MWLSALRLTLKWETEAPYTSRRVDASSLQPQEVNVWTWNMSEPNTAPLFAPGAEVCRHPAKWEENSHPEMWFLEQQALSCC